MDAQNIKLTIESLEFAGDGKSTYNDQPIYIPYGLPQEIVSGRLWHRRGAQQVLQIETIDNPSPLRTNPFCGYFTTCGGCALQHLSKQFYKEFKIEQVYKTLKQRGLNAEVKDLFWGELGQRRRVSFSFKMDKNQLHFGFFKKNSNKIISIERCPLLVPELNNLIKPLKDFLGKILVSKNEGFVHLTNTEQGIDLSWSRHRFRSKDLTKELWSAWADFAREYKISRVTRAGKELILQLEEPYVLFHGHKVAFPPASFLQPSIQSQNAMADQLNKWMSQFKLKEKKVADLFCGLGTFSFLMSTFASVDCFDCDGDAIIELKKAANSQMYVVARDLFASPLSVDELVKYEFILVDPPRAGACDQIKEIADAKVPNVAMISCDVATFARDAKILVDAGYEMSPVYTIDQFAFSSHLEVMALFTINHH